MKQNIHHLYYLFYPRGWIIIALLLFSTIAEAQESTPQEFHIGSKPGRFPQQEDSTMNSYFECGFNGIWWEAYPYVKVWLDDGNLELLAENGHSREDYVYHYATGYYSKWEAEVDAEAGRVGLKHRDSLGILIGSYSTWQDTVSCWSSIGLTGPRDSLIYGPHYRQEKRYKRWYVGEPDTARFNLYYNVRFRMALSNSLGVSGDEDVCVIKVVYRYAKVYSPTYWTFHDEVFQQKTLKVQDFLEGGEFKYFSFNGPYIYPKIFRPQEVGVTDYEYKLELPAPSTITYTDTEAGLGIQFCVEWLRTNDLCTLYVDNIEVYDNDGWDDYINPLTHNDVIQNIKKYADSVSNDYDYLKYFYVHDEPYTLDAFIPYHTVEQIVMNETGIPLITEFYPYWTWDDSKINGEDFLQQWYDIGQPQKLMIDFYPFSPDYPFRFTDAEELRKRLQKCSELQPGFWYSAQASGWYDLNNDPVIWRQPDSSEFKATVMLALAHGISGIELFSYTTFGNDAETYTKGIVENRGTEQFARNDLWYHLKEGLIPRLKGKLGKTLMKLDYAGDFIQYRYQIPTQNPFPNSLTHDYLTLGCNYSTAHEMNWHCGFFDSTGHPENKYFMLVNLYQNTDSQQVKVCVSEPDGGYDYANYRFRNIEGIFDTTFNGDIEKWLTHIKGEGYLYQVAPVIRYGGRLLNNEATVDGMSLEDDMIIENGAVLTVNGVYSSKGNITVKSGGIINGSNGKIQFAAGKKLIIEGTAVISGTSGDKLELDFVSPTLGNGIVINQGGSLNISYCSVGNATNGINANLNTSGLYIYNTDFSGCSNSSINITGQTADGAETPPPPEIKYCTITGTLENWGISVFNLPEIIIQENDIQNTNVAIFLSQVPHAHVINNTITNNTYTSVLQGILLTSVGGDVRGNTISRHSEGIRIANSPSLNIGGNEIHDCKYHGIFIDVGSNPYMIGRLIYDITFHGWYAISGYNNIYDNGGYYEPLGPPYNDGSEIYINRANVQMREGCNLVVDNRIVIEDPRPGDLAYTQYLMNGRLSQAGILNIENNFWDVHPVYPLSTRFGSLIVDYTPYKTEACEIPVAGGMLITRTSTGQAVDTLYAISEETGEIAEIEELYGTANKLFITGEIESSESYYDQVISIDTTLIEKVEAFAKKYEIGKLLVRDQEYFDELRTIYTSLASSTYDSLLIKIFNQLSTLCLVGQKEYTPAINEFDEIIQQNPNTEEAVFAEIDAVTTGMLIEGNDSTLQKGRLGKYLIKPESNHFSKLNRILKKNFGTNKEETEEEILPTEYTLYQNYPNPFNPTTTIKYDLPNTTDVSLIIYDILGRKVKELVNTKQQAGKYEVQFDASNLASGVYIYQLVADKFISSKKMILLK